MNASANPGGIDGRSGPATEAERLSVWYDGACPLCRREIRLMQWLDWRDAIRFTDIAGAGAGSLDCSVDTRDLASRLHAREDSEMLDGAAAFAAMWRAIPVLRPLGLAARNPVVLAVLERLYGGFLTIRPGLQRVVRRIAHR